MSSTYFDSSEQSGSSADRDSTETQYGYVHADNTMPYTYGHPETAGSTYGLPWPNSDHYPYESAVTSTAPPSQPPPDLEYATAYASSYSAGLIPSSSGQPFTASSFFNDVIGSIPDIAKQACDQALQWLSKEQDWGLPEISARTGEALADAAASLEAAGMVPSNQDSLEVFRRTAQQALSSQLIQIINSESQDPVHARGQAEQAAWEVAYQLQYQLRHEGATNGHDICYFAIAECLQELQEQIGAEDGGGHAEPEGAVLQEPGMSIELADGHRQSTGNHRGRFPCQVPDCGQKPFRRQADLDRHVRHVHTDDDQRLRFMCDYRNCTRGEYPFYRRDHFRDHLRDYHMEDLVRRGVNNQNEEWWATRSSKSIQNGWWRCSRCLITRVRIDTYGYVCPNCRGHCESSRQAYREGLQT